MLCCVVVRGGFNSKERAEIAAGDILSAESDDKAGFQKYPGFIVRPPPVLCYSWVLPYSPRVWIQHSKCMKIIMAQVVHVEDSRQYEFNFW